MKPFQLLPALGAALLIAEPSAATTATSLSPPRAAISIPAHAAASGAQGAGSLEAGEQQVPAAPVSLKLEVTPRAPFLHQRIKVEFLISIDERFLQDNLLQLFRQELDLPVQLHANWLRGNDCLRPDAEIQTAVSADADTGLSGLDPRLSLALEDGRALVERLPDQSHSTGRNRIYRLTHHFVPGCAGPLAFEAARLDYAFANAFRLNAFGEPEALERRQASIQSEPLTMDVQDFPEQNRPLAFTDAVGRFSLEAELSSNRIFVGDSVQLTMRIRGEGNLESFQPSRPDPIPGFHFLGLADSFENGERVLSYELQSKAVRTKPIEPIQWPSFDPGPPAVYRILSSESMPIEVVAAQPDSASAAEQAGQAEKQQAADSPSPPPSPPWLLGLVTTLLAALGAFAWLRLRKTAKRSS